MTPTLVAILALTVALGVWIRKRQRARVSAIDPNSAEWQAAVSRARTTLPLLRELFPAHPEQTLVKVAVSTASGSREHVWAQLKELGPETLTATIVTPVLDRRSEAGRRWRSLWRSSRTGMCCCPMDVSAEASRRWPRSRCAGPPDSRSHESSEVSKADSSMPNARMQRCVGAVEPRLSRSGALPRRGGRSRR